MFKAMLDGYTDKVQVTSDTKGFLKSANEDMDELDDDTDQLNKNWYKVAKASFDPGSPEQSALESIPTETGTPAPDTYEMNPLEQGGENGLQVLVSYLPGGGDHATTKLVKWQIVGVDPGFDHSAPLDPSGNALGPFTIGETVKVITEVSNSAGTRTTAPRTIVIEVPI